MVTDNLVKIMNNSFLTSKRNAQICQCLNLNPTKFTACLCSFPCLSLLIHLKKYLNKWLLNTLRYLASILLCYEMLDSCMWSKDRDYQCNGYTDLITLDITVITTMSPSKRAVDMFLNSSLIFYHQAYDERSILNAAIL